MSSLRIDPEQRFACSQCGRCCHRFHVVVSEAEVELYRKRNAAAWFRSTEQGDSEGGEPFEPFPGQPGFHRIRQRGDGACGFLSPDNRCRIHEELGAARKPLTCRVFPFSFHPAADAVVVTASFGCPTIVANQGQPIAAGASLIEIESLRKEWRAVHPSNAAPLELVAGRKMEPRTARVLREGLLAMLQRNSVDLRDNVDQIATTLDDLTRSRVLALSDTDFAEYVALTVPHAVTTATLPAPRKVSTIGRLLQYGFLFTVTAVRAQLEEPGQSRWSLRLRSLQLLAHFHGLAPGRDRVNVKRLGEQRVNINDAEIRPIVVNYLRSTVATLGAHGRPLVDELAVAVSYLNAAGALAIMNAGAAGRMVDGEMFSAALMEAADVSRARNALLDWVVNRFSGGTEAVHFLATSPSVRSEPAVA
jgi:Fe-S-cluster containining protein